MASIRERKKKDGTSMFHAQVRMTGYPARTETFTTRRKAERWAKTVEAKMIEGKHYRSVEARRCTLGDAIERYVVEELPQKRDSETRRSRLQWWKDQLGNLKLAELTPAIIVECRNKLRIAKYRRGEGKPERQFRPATVNRFLASLSHVLTIARREWHWMSHNPMDGVSKLSEGAGRDRTLTGQERCKLLQETAKDATLHTFVVIALSTACRAGELQKLTWSDVDLKRGRLLFRETKNSQPRAAWLHGEALRLLKGHAKVRRLRGGPVFPLSRRAKPYPYFKPFKAAAKSAGIGDLRFHDLRHTAATLLAQDGATEQQLRAIGGWKSTVVNRYVHLAAEDAKGALEKLAGRIAGE